MQILPSMPVMYRSRGQMLSALLLTIFPAIILLLSGSSVSAQNPDVIMRDCANDAGAESNGACATYYQSPAIWVRSTQGGVDGSGNPLPHENPIAGQTNWIYIKLENISPYELLYGAVRVYFAKASTGLIWPDSWVNNGIYGHEISAYFIDHFQGGASVIVEIPWNDVPDPADFNDPDANHFCLLARFESPFDPMTYTEVASTPTNTQNNNNIVWKNCTIMNRQKKRAALDVANPNPEPLAIRLKFTVPGAETGDPLTGRCSVKIDLGNSLYTLWSNGGKQKSGMVEIGNNTLQVDAVDAWIGGMTLPPASRYTMHLENADCDTDPAIEGAVYHLQVEQYIDGSEELVGGEIYDMHMTGQEELGKRAKSPESNLSTLFMLGARPNPTPSSAMIAFTLPHSGHATLAIYDVNGRLVRTLLSGAEQAAGAHTAEWDGRTSDGAFAPSGTYIYRLSTELGSVEKQLKIVR